MSVKNKLIPFLLTFIIILSFGQGVIVQAATSDLKITSDDTSSAETQSSNYPNPGKPESKPNLLNVIAKYNTQIVYNTGDSNMNITSTIGWKKENGYWYYYKSDNTRASNWIKA